MKHKSTNETFICSSFRMNQMTSNEQQKIIAKSMAYSFLYSISFPSEPPVNLQGSLMDLQYQTCTGYRVIYCLQKSQVAIRKLGT